MKSGVQGNLYDVITTGVDVHKLIRRESNRLIIMLAVLDGEPEQMKGFDLQIKNSWTTLSERTVVVHFYHNHCRSAAPCVVASRRVR